VASILVVDDERDIVQVLSEFLSIRGHDVWEARSAERALDLALGHPFDVIFLDIVMPGMDGNEALQRLKGASPRSAVIMISGVSDEEIAIRSLDLGAFDYIRKPFDFAHLDKVVSLCLSMSRPPTT
jgi:DNA-binding response OmpR family regulator